MVQEDVLHGHSNSLLAPYAATSGWSHSELVTWLGVTEQTAPKAFLGLVKVTDTLTSIILHCMMAFRGHPVDTSHGMAAPWLSLGCPPRQLHQPGTGSK